MNAEAPTPAANAAAPMTLRRILVPTDFSAEAGKALRYAQRLGAQFGSEIVLLHVFHPPVYAYEGMLSEEITATFQDTAIKEVGKRLDAMCVEIATACGLTVRGIVADGLVYEQVELVAKREEADLILVSTHGYTGMRHMVRLGSTAERIVRHSPCPVLVVRENERDFVA